MKDERYTITQEQVDHARVLALQGMKKTRIAEITGLSRYQVYYWTNDEARETIRKRNAKRTHEPGDKARIEHITKKRKERWEENPDSKLAHQISSALNETRVSRKSVKGMEIDEAKELRDSGALKVPNAKIK
tara:strand:- start:97 stop:492 length:396 start_codon:yes stop_codon:yes gene_type:complete